ERVRQLDLLEIMVQPHNAVFILQHQSAELTMHWEPEPIAFAVCSFDCKPECSATLADARSASQHRNCASLKVIIADKIMSLWLLILPKLRRRIKLQKLRGLIQRLSVPGIIGKCSES